MDANTSSRMYMLHSSWSSHFTKRGEGYRPSHLQTLGDPVSSFQHQSTEAVVVRHPIQPVSDQRRMNASESRVPEGVVAVPGPQHSPGLCRGARARRAKPTTRRGISLWICLTVLARPERLPKSVSPSEAAANVVGSMVHAYFYTFFVVTQTRGSEAFSWEHSSFPPFWKHRSNAYKGR
jgi:hypothetical protein